ncbi:MAG: hypothetical protein ABEH88_01495 [Halobacteriales archaeon]
MSYPIPKRRTVIVGLVSALILLSGCAAVSNDGEESGAKLGDITVENSDETAHTVHVLVERGSEPIYGTAIGLDGVSPPANESDFGSIDTTVLNHSAWTGESDDWTVYTRVGTNTSWKAHAVPTEDDGACYSVRLKIEVDGSATGFTPDCASWPPTSDS